MPAIIGGAIAGGGSLLSGLVGGKGAKSAASASAAASQQAAANQLAEWQTMYNQQQPFIAAGQNAANELQTLFNYGGLGQNAPLDQASIANMPGYQFTLGQGLAATQNAAAAKGLGVSGSALQGAANYATGLASANFQNYFNDYWANQQNRYNQLAGLAGLGANVSVGAGTQAVQSGANQAQALQAAGGAQALGIQGSTNALTGGLMGALYNPQVQNSLTQGLQSLFGSGGSTLSAGATNIPGYQVASGFNYGQGTA